MRRFLRFLLKTAEKYHKPIAVKTTENSENIRGELSTNLEQTVSAFHIFQIARRDTLDRFKNIKHLDNLILNLPGLFLKETLEIVLIYYDFSVFSYCKCNI